ncbi:uncharacterized protein LOC129610342 [Condylostylus longicornis]|uniref:uncharacterized protein LOC129610342 n=1 Tax=Condylostylus longicornis TaxID=2530218 RepID=UPI00244DFC41|nr:uncharacterized protein LOC129610342 [Condylostylus longicornis]
MKFLGCLIFALIAAFAVVSATNSTWGARNWNDQMIFRQNIVIKGNYPTYNLTFPARAGANTRKITYILARDLTRFGNGGQATLYRGGVGFKNVTLIFRSQSNTGLNMTAEIWGR